MIAQIFVRTRDYPTERSEGAGGSATVAAQRPTEAEYFLYFRGGEFLVRTKIKQGRERIHVSPG
jgi:hypothetical protein